MPIPAHVACSFAAVCLLAAGSATAQMRVEPRNQVVPERVDAQLPEGASRFEPIHVAAMHGDVERIANELRSGTAVDLRIRQGLFAGATPLMMAARDADAEVMEFLLANGADVNARDDRRVSVLMWASSSAGSVDKIAVALKAGAEVNPRSRDGATALHWAAGLGRDPEMVRVLIEAGASLDLPDDRGRTPLMTAARVGNSDAVGYLLAAGVDRSRRSPQGLTALHWAAEGREGTPETVRLLVDAGAAVDSRAADGSTPLIIAALNGRAPQMTELLALGANPDATNSWGLTPLMAAASDGTPDVVKAILDAEPNLNARDQAGRVALHYAVAKNNGIATAMIARRGPDPDVVDSEGWRPIHLARTMATLDPLVRAGADLDARCAVPQYRGWTPLMFAAATGNTFLARRLLNAEADPSVTTDNQTNAMRIAMAVQYPEGGNPMADLIRGEIAERQAEYEIEHYGGARPVAPVGPAPDKD